LVNINNRAITFLNATRVVNNDNLSFKAITFFGCIITDITTNCTFCDIFLLKIFHIKTNIITRKSFIKLSVVSFNRSNLKLSLCSTFERSKANGFVGLKNTRFNSTWNNNTNTIYLKNTLNWNSKILFNWSNRRSNTVQSFKYSVSFVPRHFITFFSKVMTMISRDGNELNILEIETYFLKTLTNFWFDVIKSLLTKVYKLIIHLVNTNHDLSKSKSVSKKNVFTSLSIMTKTSFKTTLFSSDNKDTYISLCSTSDHILKEILMTRSINNSIVKVISVEF